MKKVSYGMPLSVKILLCITIPLLLLAFLAPVIWPIDLGATDLRSRLAIPSIFGLSDSGHLFGTDYLGRDLGIRLLYATRSSIMICFIGLFFSTLLGLGLGILAGVCGGVVDDIVMFLVNVRLSVPAVLIGIIVSVIFNANETTMVFLITFIQWTNPCRQTRAAIMQIKHESYIECSKAIGASNLRIVFEHYLRNVASPLIVVVTMNISSIILFESTLSFLGLGIQPPNTSLGVMVNAGREQMILQWWQAILPTAIICLIVITASLTGDYLRDRLDPKLKKR